jgi:triacylglycerol lipase
MKPLDTSKLLRSTLQASAQTIARQLRREKSEPAKNTYPIVLMHGLAGFRDISFAGFKLFDYFNGVELMLNQMGYPAFAPQVPFFAKPQDRASAWFHEIEKIRRDTGAAKVHLVGHSQGGLDARVLVAENQPAKDTPLGPLMGLGYGDRVASVVTVGTPHLGSAIADSLDLDDSRNAELTDALTEFISVIARVLSGDPQDAKGAIQALSRDYMLNYFNPIIKDNPAVPCYTIAGDPETSKLLTPLLYAFYKGLLDIPPAEGGGRNDGLVTVKSALFGCPLIDGDPDFACSEQEHPRPHWQPLGLIQADHVEMVGIPAQINGKDVYDHLAAFAGLAQFLDQNLDMNMKLKKNGEWTRTPKKAPKKAPKSAPGSRRPGSPAVNKAKAA